MTLEILDPRTFPDAALEFRLSTRLPTLQGKRLLIVSTGKRNSSPLLVHVAQELKKQYGLAEFVVRDKPSSSTCMPSQWLDEIKGKYDLAITGVGD